MAPMPMPMNDEDHDGFMDRCMGDDMMNEDFKETEQRQAVCETQWRKVHEDGQAGATKYQHVLSMAYSTPWAILPERWAVIHDLLMFRASGGHLNAEEIQTRIGAAARPTQRTAEAVAVIPIHGVIIPRASMLAETSGAVSVERIQGMLREALNDRQVSSILLDIDSPGGAVTGIDELSAEIYRSRGTKPIRAIASPMAASAAYWLGTAADDLCVTPSGDVGSIGVFAAHEDMSRLMDRMGVTVSLISAGKYKTEGNPYMPLGDEARAAIQDRVSDYYGMFVDAVARNRGVTSTQVREGFGEGRMVGARRAVAERMADRIGTIDDLMREMMQPARKPGKSATSDSLRLRAQASAARGRLLMGAGQ